MVGALSLSAAEEGVMKTIGVILIALGVFGLAWGVLRTRRGRRSSTSDRFTLPATRHIMYPCLPSQAR